MKSNKKIILSIIVLTVIAGIAYGFYTWFKPTRDVGEEKGIKITAAAIFDSFTVNENKSNKLYLNKAIEVTGEVTEIKTNQVSQTVVYLKSNDPVFGVNCTFKENPGVLTKGSTITFKGICTGYLSDVIINQGIIIKH